MGVNKMADIMEVLGYVKQITDLKHITKRFGRGDVLAERVGHQTIGVFNLDGKGLFFVWNTFYETGGHSITISDEFGNLYDEEALEQALVRKLEVEITTHVKV